jgi:hypothetical protein
VPNRWESKDNNNEIFGGNSLFREVIQEADGTLDTRFPEEMIPETGAALSNKIIADIGALPVNATGITLNSPGGLGIAHMEGLPANYRITLEIEPNGANEEYGMFIHSGAKAEGGYRLNLSAANKSVHLGNTAIEGVDGLDKKIRIDVVVKDGIIDVDIDHRRTIINRTYEQNGDMLWFYAKHGKVTFSTVIIYPLK